MNISNSTLDESKNTVELLEAARYAKTQLEYVDGALATGTGGSISSTVTQAAINRLGKAIGNFEATLFVTTDLELGVVRLERWPEGFVLWQGGEIAWRSWK